MHPIVASFIHTNIHCAIWQYKIMEGSLWLLRIDGVGVPGPLFIKISFHKAINVSKVESLSGLLTEHSKSSGE